MKSVSQSVHPFSYELLIAKGNAVSLPGLISDNV